MNTQKDKNNFRQCIRTTNSDGNDKGRKKRNEPGRGGDMIEIAGADDPEHAKTLASRAQGDADLEQQTDKLAVQLDEEVGLADELGEAAGLERRRAPRTAHPASEAASAG